MSMGRIIEIFLAIVAVAMAFTLVNPKNHTADIITAFGKNFAQSIHYAAGGK